MDDQKQDLGSHAALVAAVLEAAEDLEAVAATNACELSEDGAQPHLIAGLNGFELALAELRERLAQVARGTAPEPQQALSV
jgi:hypothetical protein